MIQVPFQDISYAQGYYDMSSNHDDFVMIKMSGGDDGLYYDSKAARNYNNATAMNKITGLYHFYGGGDPVVEADFFIGACSPLGENDLLAVDVERGATWNPQTDPGCVAKVLAFANRVYQRTGLWPWVYLNRSTRQMYDWSPVLSKCALWIAAPDVSFDADIPGIGVYMAQQGPIVNGVDSDMYFGSLDSLKQYTFGGINAPATTTTTQTPAPAPEPTTTTTTTELPPQPDPTTTTTTTEKPQPPSPTTTTTTTPATGGVPVGDRWTIIVFLVWLLNKLRGKK